MQGMKLPGHWSWGLWSCGMLHRTVGNAVYPNAVKKCSTFICKGLYILGLTSPWWLRFQKTRSLKKAAAILRYFRAGYNTVWLIGTCRSFVTTIQIKMTGTHNEDSTLGCSKVNNERVNRLENLLKFEQWI